MVNAAGGTMTVVGIVRIKGMIGVLQMIIQMRMAELECLIYFSFSCSSCGSTRGFVINIVLLHTGIGHLRIGVGSSLFFQVATGTFSRDPNRWRRTAVTRTRTRTRTLCRMIRM